MNKTLVLGASLKSERYSYRAVLRLRTFEHSVIAYGGKAGQIADVEVEKEWYRWDSIDTVTLYMNAKRQEDYIDRILELNPRRVIFNPGAENPAFYTLLENKGIVAENACTLVLLSIGNY